MSFFKIPEMIQRALFLIQALNIPEARKLAQGIMYLWREFYIKTKIIPKIQFFTVEFKYKDETLNTFRIENIKDLNKIIDKLKMSRIDKETN